jgi:hypothetical protein
MPTRSIARIVASLLALSIAPFVLAAFAPQQPPKPKPDAQQVPFPEQSTRGCTRILYFNGDHAGGEVAVDYGRPAWKDDYDAVVAKADPVRWRFGQNFWTNLDTNIDLSFGTTEIAPGQWYLVLERKADGSFALVFLDPVEVRDHHVDAFTVALAKGGTEVPLTYRQVEARADHLLIRIDLDRAKNGAKLVIQFGKHELTTPFVMKPAP